VGNHCRAIMFRLDLPNRMALLRWHDENLWLGFCVLLQPMIEEIW